MSGTPRLRSSFPSTPGSAQRTPETRESRSNGSAIKKPSSLPNAPSATPQSSAVSNTPVIPVALIDAPSQRMYTLGIYGILLVWRLYDWYTLIEAETSSVALFLKWTFIDLIFSFGVPLLRIPWLEWSETLSTGSCAVHALLNATLMLRLPVSHQNRKS